MRSVNQAIHSCFFFLVTVAICVTGLGWYSSQVHTRWSVDASHVGVGQSESVRRELIETLDRLVSYENYYRSTYGHFTQLLSRVGFSIPRSVLTKFEIRVDDASVDRVLVRAFSEVDGRLADQISIDQDYRLNANFPLPAPRPEYLRLQALKQLRNLREAPAHRSVAETGVFRGYFRYEVHGEAIEHRTAIAVGTRPPVVGVQLELGASGSSEGWSDGELDAWLIANPAQLDEYSHLSQRPTGQRAVGNVMTTLEEAYLAQRIFHGEIGRYARSWSELSKIADFRFEGRDGYSSDESVPFRGGEGAEEADAHAEDSLSEAVIPGGIRAPAGASGANDIHLTIPKFSVSTPALDPGHTLEIEPISPDAEKALMKGRSGTTCSAQDARRGGGCAK